MNPQVKQRVSPNWVALSLALLLAVWLGFQFLPQKKPALPPVMAVAESKLHAVGLADNPDWEGLPEFFAIVADKADWREGRTRFAYWHPVMKTYSYYFEATRDGERVSFKEISEPHDSDHYWDEGMAEESLIRFYYSVPAPVYPRFSTSVISDPVGRDIKVEINMDKTAPSIPSAEKIVIPENPAPTP